MKPKAWMADVAARMLADKQVWLSTDEWAWLERTGVVYRPEDDYELTPAGRTLAQAREATNALRRSTRNANARGRASALRSVGLKKTPYGWE